MSRELSRASASTGTGPSIPSGLCYVLNGRRVRGAGRHRDRLHRSILMGFSYFPARLIETVDTGVPARPFRQCGLSVMEQVGGQGSGWGHSGGQSSSARLLHIIGKSPICKSRQIFWAAIATASVKVG